MDELLKKITSYQIFNNLLPGCLIYYAIMKLFQIDTSKDNLIISAFLAYFLGMVASRVGSLQIEPFLKKIRFLKFRDYSLFMDASDKDPKIEILSETNNIYRSLIGAFLIIILLFIGQTWIPERILKSPITSIIGLVFLCGVFLSAYRKQTKYIVSRIDKRTKENE